MILNSQKVKKVKSFLLADGRIVWPCPHFTGNLSFPFDDLGLFSF